MSISPYIHRLLLSGIQLHVPALHSTPHLLEHSLLTLQRQVPTSRNPHLSELILLIRGATPVLCIHLFIFGEKSI